MTTPVFEFKTTHQFLGPKGLTSSEANHFCNLIKELSLTRMQELDNLTTLTRTMRYNSEEIPVTKANFDFDKVMEAMSFRPEMNQLAACLREAIKAREVLFAGIEDQELPTPVHPTPITSVAKLELPPRPQKPERVTPPELLPQVGDGWGKEQLDVRQLGEMLAAEAAAAGWGQYLHNKGFLERLRAEGQLPGMYWERDCPVVVNTHKLSEVDDAFFYAQQQHRKYEKQLNMYRSMIHDKMNAENQERTIKNQASVAEFRQKELNWHNQYQKEDTAWMQECEKLQLSHANAVKRYDALVAEQSDAWQTRSRELQLQFEEARATVRRTVAALKIIVPAALEPLVEKLKTLTTVEAV